MRSWVEGKLGRYIRQGVLVAGAIAALAIAQTGAFAIADAVPETPRFVPAMRVGAITSQPIGHYEFCQRSPEECDFRTRDARPMELDARRWIAIGEINDMVNGGIEPRTDMEMHGVGELWSFPDVAGDCEDFVLLKRRLLIDRGFNPANLLITVVRRPNGEGHAVLTVRTDRGDFILDNLETDILVWTDTPYRFLKRQSAHHSGRWVDVTNGSVGYTAAIR